MKQLLKNKKDIIAWLGKHKIKNYKLVPSTIYGYKVDVRGSVDLSDDKFYYRSQDWQGWVRYVETFRVKRWVRAGTARHKKIKFIPIKFNIVSKTLNLNNNGLTNMRAMPKKVGKHFSMFDNSLKNLKGLPKTIGGGINLYSNKLEHLIGAPKIVYGGFNVESNSIKSLKGAPEIVQSFFAISLNPLTSLAHSPKKVGTDYVCRNNNLTSLKGISEYIEGRLIISNEQSSQNRSLNAFQDFDYLPKKLGGIIEFSHIDGLKRYENLTTNEIIEMVKIREKQKKLAKKEKIAIGQELKGMGPTNLDKADGIKPIGGQARRIKI